jgi:hypothetical protein
MPLELVTILLELLSNGAAFLTFLVLSSCQHKNFLFQYTLEVVELKVMSIHLAPCGSVVVFHGF